MKLRSKKSLGESSPPPPPNDDGMTNTSVKGEGENGQESGGNGRDGPSTVLRTGVGVGDGGGTDGVISSTTTNNNSFQFPFFDNDQSIDLSTRSVSFIRETDKSNNGTAKPGFLTPPPTSTSRQSVFETRDPRKSPFESFHSRSIGSSSVDEDAPQKSTTDEETMMMMTAMLSPITKSRDSGEHAIVLSQSTDPIGNEQLSRHGDDDHDGDALNRQQPTTPPPQATRTGTSDASSQFLLPPVVEEGNGTSGDCFDLSSAKKQVGESSSRFIGEIKSAARRRRVEVARSRDSLVAKEKEQLRSIAESNKARLDAEAVAAAAQETSKATSTVGKPRRSDIAGRKHFDSQRFAGFGVPKVEKRPVTTPFSPLLGSRRRKKVAIKSLQQPRASIGIYPGKNEKNETKNTREPTRRATISSTVHPVSNETTNISTCGSTIPFRARPLPSTTGSNGHAGQAGVPKVPKRPVTVPKSPCLGPKHQNRRGTTKKTVSKGLSISIGGTKRDHTYASAYGKAPATTPMSGSFSSSASSELLGLAMLDSPSAFESSVEEGTIRQGIGNQTPTPSRNIAPSNNFPDTKPYVPRSTCRANKRAEYDARRNQNIQRRIHEERKFLQGQIKLIHRELEALKTQL